MRVAVIGANGQLGTDLVKVFDAVPLTHEDIDVTDPDSLNVLKEIGPDVVVNTAAYVRVDDAEVEAEEAFRVNAVGALNVARACDEIDAINVYISTDYVFDGAKGEPYVEQDIPNPINVYGLSKYAGEVFTRNYSSRHYIIRVASLYGNAGGGNFVDFMIQRAGEEGAVRVVDDVFMSPTYTKDVSYMLRRFFGVGPEFGVYHFVNEGCCSWYDFAREIFDILGEDVRTTPIKSDELRRRARRPVFSALKNKKLEGLGLRMRGWEEALRGYLAEEMR
jgi:dTDP-4-dehydrorhamnose reductase (EC 1.1.1.133)